MSSSSTAKVPLATPAHERGLRERQRQKLIDACISALYEHGPSRTTIDKVVSIAGMSPGIVNFYFTTKAALMVAALEFLATEFAQYVMAPVEMLRETPVQALETLIELYLDPDLASPRKVSVWYSFWGEANSRREYHDICGKKDDQFASLLIDLIERLIEQSGRTGLDADGVALGLIGALEILWQGIAFQDEKGVDRETAKRRCRAYLSSIFPELFNARTKPIPADQTSANAPLPGWAYADNQLFDREKTEIFFGSWHFVCMEEVIGHAGDYVTIDLLGDRAFAIRGSDGKIRAFRNNCTQSPHAILTGAQGHSEPGVRCWFDGHLYDIDDANNGLTPLPSLTSGGLVFISLGSTKTPPPISIADVLPDGIDTLENHETLEVHVHANWKVIVEYWLKESGDLVNIRQAGATWQTGSNDNGRLREKTLFVWPNILINTQSDMMTIKQIIPLTAHESRIKQSIVLVTYDKFESGWEASLLRIKADLLKEAELAGSTQIGLTGPVYSTKKSSKVRDASAYFRQHLRERLPEIH